MFGGLGNMAGMLKQAREMQTRLKTIQEEIAQSKYDADSGAGAVNATVSGRGELLKIKINPDTVKAGDVELLEDLVRSAVCAAQRKATDGAKAKMAELTGGLNLPGLDSLMGGP
ncbi:MAG: YbaB/EbfC family nucleoid-associated protein [Planctomycetota bacterium]|nr:MAG: YbaB/EbfC family nucleoid-associated protein [Planctomycetota bacterium]